MSLFTFKYKLYEDCPLTTMLSRFLSSFQRILLFLSVVLLAVIVLDTPPNWGEGLIMDVVMFVLYLIIRFFKEKWCDSLAEKEILKNR